MNISIPTNHNYYEEAPIAEGKLQETFGIKTRAIKKLKSDIFSSVHEITTKESSLEQIQIFGFKQNKLENEEQLILKLYAKQSTENHTNYFVQTGLFAGVIYHKGCQFNITTAYGDIFLQRMLNYVNDIYIDNQKIQAEKKDETNEFQNIIAYLFIQSLEKASVLGLPKLYKEMTQHSSKVRGKIDINAYLRNNTPFTGKITTNYREQVYVQEIIDVLFQACRILEKKIGKDIHRKILGVYQLLKQSYSGNFPTPRTIQSAINHSTLQNPMFAGFKNVLKYAEIILQEQNLILSDSQNDLSTHGYLFDISQLFEVYLEKLLNRHFKDWYISGQEELMTYSRMFYSRKMFPDLVMRNKESNELIVFDAKYKKMRLEKRDVDRSDFYQIHSYIQYYQPDVCIGGLIYPLSKQISEQTAHADSIFNNQHIGSKFIVDGIFINESMDMTGIEQSENEFLSRIDSLINKNQTLNTLHKLGAA